MESSARAIAAVSLRGRSAQVRDRIDRAAIRAGREASDITLVAVTKVFPASVIREAYGHCGSASVIVVATGIVSVE